MTPHTGPEWTRRNALKFGARLTGSLFAASLGFPAAFASDSDTNDTTPGPQARQQIETILQAKGKESDGVLSISIVRKDLKASLHGHSILPSFLLHGELVFQQGPGGSLMMNGDMCLRAGELNPFIRALVSHNLAFQAEHQHFYDFSPMVWFIHFRGMADAPTLAHSLKAALDKTATPFPQSPEPQPTTTLPAAEIGRIVGAKPEVSEGGVVTFNVPRAETIRLGGHTVRPLLNVMTTIQIQPLAGGNVAAVPDFGMTASEINSVVSTMEDQGWDSGCLYNQETDEHPQLYFDHFFKAGDPIQLAHEIRKGLGHMNVKLK